MPRSKHSKRRRSPSPRRSPRTPSDSPLRDGRYHSPVDHHRYSPFSPFTSDDEVPSPAFTPQRTPMATPRVGMSV